MAAQAGNVEQEAEYGGPHTSLAVRASFDTIILSPERPHLLPQLDVGLSLEGMARSR
jgi:hypothetical protein